MNQTHTTDFEGQPGTNPVFIHCSLLAATMHACSAPFIEACISGYCFSLSSPPPLPLFFFSSLSHRFFPFLSLWLLFLSPFTLSLFLWPIFCLIAPISSTSHCPNSESVHFNLRDRLVGMMYSLSWFAAGHAHRPVHQNRLAGCEIL